MIQALKKEPGNILNLCKQYHVSRLELFGSAATSDFDSDESDFDFLVEFHPLEFGEYADAYFGLLESLEDLFNRSIDLVMISAIDNPYFLESINQNRVLLYGN